MSEILRSLSMLWSLFHILILFLFLYRSRFDRKKTVLLTGICMGTLIIISVVGMVWLGYERMAQIMFFTCTIPSLVFFWFLSADRGGRFLFTLCLSDTFSLWILIVTHLLDFYLGQGRCIVMFLTRLIAFPAAEYVAVHYLRKPYLELQKYVERGWGIAAGLSALYYLLMIRVSSFPVFITKRLQEMPVMVLILILMPLTYACIMFALYQQLITYRTKENDKLLSIQKAQLEAQLGNYESLLRARHDMRALWVTLAGLLENKEYEDAQALIAEIDKRNEEKNCKYCTDSYINAVLTQYVQLFKEKEARLTITMQPEGAFFSGIDLSLILANALDNSLRAVSNLPEESRETSVQFRRKNDYLLLRIRNACAPEFSVAKGEIPPTTKTDPGHGYGLETIFKIADALGGNAVCYTENQQFVLDVYVNCCHGG